ncbi:response regulator [Terasakiella sp. SH-1]|uniref:response regulator n=1 Tax=Terasakiella sp. SH-1 TaxID=2560057 RepID=UPI001073D30B|nr:response regulator [Terasakiella sp. SH-1]
MAHVLVIDDEELARYTVREILEGFDHSIIEAKNGNEGIEQFHNNDIDLIITDIIMPEKEGVEMIIELKREDPNLKIIAISGGGRTRNLDFLQLANEFGADKVLSKPFSSADLISAVNACLT